MLLKKFKNIKMKAEVAILIGSITDLEKINDCLQTLENFNVAYDCRVLSAHRTPDLVKEFVKKAEESGVKVIIAAASGAAHLPGVIASYTILPVIGIPLRSQISLNGLDSILSILQMPSGVPVATVGLDNSKNAALLALQILAINNPSLKQKLLNFKNDMANKVLESQSKIDQLNYYYLTKI